MSFAKIAEARAVKKIVAYVRKWGRERVSWCSPEELADEIEAGEWKDIVLPKPAKKAKKR